MRRLSKENLILITAAIIVIAVLNQSYHPLVNKSVLTLFFSLAIYQRIKDRTPQILAQSLLWCGMIIAILYEFWR